MLILTIFIVFANKVTFFTDIFGARRRDLQTS